MNSSIEEQLSLLKGMTIRTGVIHEAQRLQLEMWPRMSKQIESCTPKANFENKLILLDCKSRTKKFKMSEFETKLFENIVLWVRKILWDETIVQIKVNGKTVYDSSDA